MRQLRLIENGNVKKEQIYSPAFVIVHVDSGKRQKSKEEEISYLVLHQLMHLDDKSSYIF